MIQVILGLAILAGGPPSTDPTVLVEELGSGRYLEREKAEATLTRLGRVAIPALRAASDARDPEIRLRASSILARIEGSLLVQPTALTLDFQDQPLSEIIRTINQRSGLSLRLVADDRIPRNSSRLTVRSADPLPFWQAVDALCAAGDFHYSLGASEGSSSKSSSFPLYLGKNPRLGPTSDSGPFRTHLASIHYQSEISLSPDRPIPNGKIGRPATIPAPIASEPNANRQFYLQGVVAAEPRLSISQNGAVRVNEAIDDSGQSLIIPASSGSVLRSSGYFGMTSSPFVRFRVDLAYPESISRRIKRLKGSMPLVVSTRKPDPLKVVLAGSTGKRFSNPDVELTLGEVRSNPGWTIELKLKQKPGTVIPVNPAEGDSMVARLESPHQQLEILDDQGEPIPWFPTSSLFSDDETRLTLTLLSDGRAAKPVSIVYHGIIRAATEVTFEFRDVPIP